MKRIDIDELSDLLFLGSKHYFSPTYLRRKRKEEAQRWDKIPAPKRSTASYVGFFRRLRIKTRVTQQELALRMKTAQSTVSEFESGWGNPTLDFLNRYCQGLGVDVEISFKVQNE